MLVELAFVMERLKKISEKFLSWSTKMGGGGQVLDFMGDTAVMRGNIELMGVPLSSPTRENPDVPYNSPDKICYISPHRQYSNIFVNYKKMNIGDLTNNNDNKVHPRKVKVRWNSMKKIFSNLTENSKFTFYSQFFVLHNLRWNDGTSRCTTQSMVIRPSQPELLNLIQVFPLLHLTPVTFFPCSPLPTLISPAMCSCLW